MIRPIKYPEGGLRDLTVSDLPQFLEIRNSVSFMLHNPLQFTLEECRSWFNQQAQRYFVFETKDSGIIGYFRVKISDSNPHEAEIGLDLSPRFHGRNWSKWLYFRLINEILLPLEIQDLTLRVLRINLPAISLYTDMGFHTYQESKSDFSMRANLIDVHKYLSHYLDRK